MPDADDDAMQPPSSRGSVPALISGAVIGTLGGLIGIGGGEFRLPILVGAFRYEPRAAVPLNLLITLVTLIASLVIRARTLSLSAVWLHLPEVVGLGAGGLIGAALAPRLLVKVSDRRLEQGLAGLLASIGVLLIVEAFLPSSTTRIVPTALAWTLPTAIALGVLIGAIAALLGVAGGEVLIPTLVLLFAVDIRTAGTASLMISLVMVMSGLSRYWTLGAFPSAASIRRTALPMGMGSIVGAALGGLLVVYIVPSVLKVVLGLVLIAAAAKTLRRRR